MDKIYTILSLSIDITSIKSIDKIITYKNNSYFININGKECQIFSIGRHEKGAEFLDLDNKLFGLHFKRYKTESDIELINLYNKRLMEIKNEIYRMIELEVEKFINYWIAYNDGAR